MGIFPQKSYVTFPQIDFRQLNPLPYFPFFGITVWEGDKALRGHA